MKHIAPFFALVFLLPGLSEAQAPKYSNEFLAIGVGARALGMGNANVATTGDATSGYWNPAGLMGLPRDMQVSLMHSEYFAGIAKYDFGAFAKKIDSLSACSFSIIRFGVDDIPNTTELIDAQGNVNYDKITKFSAADYAFIGSYARKLTIPGLSVGGNVKIIRRKIGDFAGAWGFGLDAGAQYDAKGWRFGAVLRDVTSTFNAWSFNLSDQMKQTFALTGNDIPQNSIELTLPRLILGASHKYYIKDKFSVMPELDLDMTFDGRRNTLIQTGFTSVDPHFGIEIGFKDFIYLRTGLCNMQYVTDFAGKKALNVQPNIGLGVRIKQVTIDYALTDIGDASVALYSNIFSLKFDLNKKAKTQ
ncbi:MAG TPA: PorV/PorQ family protein [Bacteroidia bacterium]|jgi:hypothetical protein